MVTYLRWWPPSTFNVWMGPLSFLWPPPGCLNNTVFSNLSLCAACWAHFMCHHEVWPTSVGHPFSFLNSSWGLTWEKHYQKITIAIFSFVLQNCTIPGYFPYISFYRYLFSSLFRLDQTALGTLTIYQIKWELPKSHVETHIKTWQK